MRFKKIITTVFFMASLANVNVCRSGAFQKETFGSEDVQLISCDFEDVIFAVIISRENQTGKRVANPTGLPKPTFIISEYYFKYNLPYAGSFEPLYVTVNGANEPTLVSLHCLLAV